ncbi:MAG: pilus assembly protein PilP [Proteobacteria bacterium]|nr:pilus assembly protein PilP [Pseudomonadota bacterium]
MTARAAYLATIAVASLLLGASCDDAPPTPPAGGAPTGAASPAAAAAASAAAAAAAPAAAAATRLELADQEFMESPENRDPFRPYVAEFLTTPQRTAKIQRKVILGRYGLDELDLIAVVAGSARARAMFRDPTGLGVTVRRGDFISKSACKVKDIQPDRVIVEIQEQLEGGQTAADRVVEMHPKGEQGEEQP